MDKVVERRVSRLFKKIRAWHARPDLPHNLSLGDFPTWFAGFMKRRFRDKHGYGLSADQLSAADDLVTERALNPRTWKLSQPV